MMCLETVIVAGMRSADTYTRVPVSSTVLLLYGQDDACKRWAAQGLGYDDLRWPDDTVAIGIERDGTLCGAALYNRFGEDECQGHFVSDRNMNWATRATLAAIFSYPFIQCGLQRITVAIKERNVPALIAAIKLGFGFEGRTRRHWSGEDEIVFGMQRADCRWIAHIGGNNGQG